MKLIAVFFLALAGFSAVTSHDVNRLTEFLAGSPKDVTACEVCHDVIDAVEAMFADPEWQHSMEPVIDQLCTYLPAKDQMMCKMAVKALFPKLMQMLDKELAKICPAAGCPNRKASANICDLITAVALRLEHLPTLAGQLCAQMPNQDLQSACEQLSSKHALMLSVSAEQVLKMAAQSANCDNIMFLNAHHRLKSQSSSAQPKSIECEACDDAVDVLDFLLKSPMVEGNLKVLLDGLCATLPKPYDKACTATVNDFMDIIVDFIVNMTKHICDSTCQKAAAPLRGEHKQNMCAGACGVLNQVYNDMPNLAARAEAVCDRIPAAALRVACHELFQKQSALVVRMGEQVVQWLATQLNKVPMQSCKQCNVAVVKAVPLIVTTSIECKACKDAIGLLDYLLKSGIVEGSLQDLLKSACKQLPEPYADDCTETVDGFMDLIMQFIIDMLDYVCQPLCTDKGYKQDARDVCGLLNTMQRKHVPRRKQVAEFCTRIPNQRLARSCHKFLEEHAVLAERMIQHVVHAVGKMPVFGC